MNEQQRTPADDLEPGGITPGQAEDEARLAAYWRANKILIGILLGIWAIVSYGCGILFVEQLNEFKIGNLRAGFWFAQQGSIVVFVVLIFVYAFAMDRLDKKYARGSK